ncbi:hypothetical protein D5F11_007240 [Siminovitchia terrae]|uniref:Uncharacterized protein n=1 Tax=Siminovitchia terrae TaxID=1914933 RepID=A0A429XA64_SIMTE|nr:hypothetical protein [Siminovitchia terrae]RST60241.1 hypothetical protein D5F11_007240 [Siminovitchia terrae]
MKKMFIFLLVFCTFFMFSISSTFASTGQVDALPSDDAEFENLTPMVDERVVNLLKENNIDFHIEDGYLIQLDNVTPELIADVNNKLEEDFEEQGSVALFAAKKYPTPYQYMKTYDRVFSKKFTMATKVAFSAGMTSWLTGKTATPASVAKVAAAAFGSYYFINSNVQNVYYFSKYYYRELGPGKVGPTGSYMGNYQIKKTERTTKNANGTGGQITERTKKSTIIEPFF